MWVLWVYFLGIGLGLLAGEDDLEARHGGQVEGVREDTEASELVDHAADATLLDSAALVNPLHLNNTGDSHTLGLEYIIHLAREHLSYLEVSKLFVGVVNTRTIDKDQTIYLKDCHLLGH